MHRLQLLGTLIPDFGASPEPKRKRRRKNTPGNADDEGGPAQGAPNRASASEKAVDKTDPAKGASPPRTQELPRTASGQTSPDPEGCPEVRKELPTGKQDKEIAAYQNLDTASGQEYPVDAAETAVPGEHEQGADWDDPSAGEQIGNRDGLGPDEEDATASGQVRGESHGSTDETIYMRGDATGLRQFRSLEDVPSDTLPVTDVGTTPGQTLKPPAEEQQAAEGATASGQDPMSNRRRGRSGTTEVAVCGPARASGRASTCTILAFTQNDPRIDLCNDDGSRVRLDRYKPQGRDPWPPFLISHFGCV